MKTFSAALCLILLFGFVLEPFQNTFAQEEIDLGLSREELLGTLVPTRDVGLNRKEVSFFGGLSYDAIAKELAHTALRTLTTSLVNWIRTGGVRGGSLFVEDFAEHFRRELDNAAGLFLEAYLGKEIAGKLCSPFRIPLGQLLTTSLGRRSFASRARCTLTETVKNLEDFRVDFTSGGWPAWEGLLEPQNNWIGSYLLAVDEASRLQEEARSRADYEVRTTGGGLLAYKECDEIEEEDPITEEPTGKTFLANCKIKTPGKVVADAVGQVFSIDIDELKLADEFNEVISASLNALVSWAITGGGSLSSLKTSKFTSDTSPPTVAMSAPKDGAFVSGTTTLRAKVTDNVAVAGVQFFLDTKELGKEDITSPYQTEWDTKTAAAGFHTLFAVARDTSDNIKTSLSVAVTVDNALPKVSVSAPLEGASVSGEVSVKATASDDAAVAGVQFFLDAKELGDEDLSSPYVVEWDTSTAASGSHTLTATVRDEAGNTATSAKITVTVTSSP